MLGWEFPPHISGGLGTACQGLVEGVTHQGVDVLFVLPRAEGDERAGSAEILGCNRFDEPASPEPPARFETIVVPSTLTPYASPAPRTAASATQTGPAPFTGGYGPGLLDEVARYAEVVGEIARTASFDVIHAHDWMTFPAAAAIAAESGKPLVAHIHASEYDRSPGAPNPDVLAIEQRGLDSADRVICVSHFTARTVETKYHVPHSRIRVVHNAVTQSEQQEEWHLTRSIDEPVVLFLGRVTGQKGPAYFLEAAKRVLELRPEVKFVMSGSGDMLPEMVELSARLGIERSVHFTGFLRGADVERMFGMADLYVMPSVAEPFGISPLEAMAQDVPVIVSRQSGVSEILQHALKVDFWDVEELANKILAVLARPSLRNMLVEEGKDEVDRMRWDERGLRVKHVYEELVP